MASSPLHEPAAMNDPKAPQGLGAQLKAVYLSSRKKRDITWNTYVARPAAAVLVYFLAKTPITPNQVSMLGALVFLATPAALIFWRSPLGLIVAALVLQLAYIFDCADGQLARLTGMTSPVGAFLDFLIDEVKALLLVAACGVRLWLIHDDLRWLIASLLGVILVSVATSLTTFVRRPEYAGEQIMPGVHAERARPTSALAFMLWVVESGAKYLIHYPSWFSYIALLGLFTPFDGAIPFLALFMGVYMLYTAKTGLAVTLKLARPGFYQPRD